jgi:hypothetical protein
MPLRVLLITPVFYGLEQKIKSTLEESGSEVVWFENKILAFDYHGTNSKFKFLRKIYWLLFSPHAKYIRKELSKIENLRFDILFSINGNAICPYLFKKLKIKNPMLFSVLYIWDASSKYNWTKEIKYFNKAFTFDPGDSKRFGIEYKPNFYVRSKADKNLSEDYDLFFAGKFNSSRLMAIDKILSKIEIAGTKYFIKLWPAYKIFFHNHLVYSLLKIFNFKSIWTRNYLINYEAVEGILKREYLIVNSLNFDEMQSHFLSSNVILDLQFGGQTGYTHRLIEALANGKKVITTNENIKNESFFNSDQIHIIDEQNPIIDFSWIKEKSVFPVDKYFLDLELSSWLKSIINVGIA